MSNRRGKMLALSAGAIMLLMGVTACGTSADGGPTTLRVQVPSGGTAEAMQAVADAFEEANEGVTVELEALDGDARRGPNAALLASSGAPDVGFLQFGSGVWSTLTKGGSLADLEDVYAANKLEDRIAPAISDAFAVEGVHYGVPFQQLLGFPVYYNVDAFTAAGIEVEGHAPESIEEFEDWSKKLEAAGYQGLTVAGASTYHLAHLFDALLTTAVTPEEFTDLTTQWYEGSEGTIDYTDPRIVELISTIAAWETTGIYQDGMLGVSDDQATGLFTGGASAMLLGGNYSYGSLTDAGFAVDWFVLPSFDDSRTTPMSSYFGDVLVVPATATNPELGKKFLEFFLTDEFQQTTIVDSGALPVFADLDISSLGGIPEPVKQMIDYSNEAGLTAMWDSVVPSGLGQPFIVPLMQQVIAGEISPEDAAQKIQDILDGLRAGEIPSDTL